MESKKIKDLLAIIFFAFGFTLVFSYFACLNRGIKVVVTNKGYNKIAFKKLDAKKDTAIRIIQFEDVANGMDYYNAINVNDTLTVSKIYEDLVYKNYVDLYYDKESRIKKVNGKKLKEIKEIARRDSLLKQMQKVR